MPSCAAPGRVAGRILRSDNRRSTKLSAEVLASRRLRSYSTKPSVIRPFLAPSSIPTRLIRIVAGPAVPDPSKGRCVIGSHPPLPSPTSSRSPHVPFKATQTHSPTDTKRDRSAELISDPQRRVQFWRVASGMYRQGRERSQGKSEEGRSDPAASSIPIAGHSHNAIDLSRAWAGNVKQKLAPRGELFAAHNWPPCDSMIERLIRRPMPVP
jgi:hypothetical protein